MTVTRRQSSPPGRPPSTDGHPRPGRVRKNPAAARWRRSAEPSR
ncbi:MAG: hypothetical protein ACK56I_17235 [bacterium]